MFQDHEIVLNWFKAPLEFFFWSENCQIGVSRQQQKIFLWFVRLFEGLSFLQWGHRIYIKDSKLLMPVVYFSELVCLFVLGLFGSANPFFNSNEWYVEIERNMIKSAFSSSGNCVLLMFMRNWLSSGMLNWISEEKYILYTLFLPRPARKELDVHYENKFIKTFWPTDILDIFTKF